MTDENMRLEDIERLDSALLPAALTHIAHAVVAEAADEDPGGYAVIGKPMLRALLAMSMQEPINGDGRRALVDTDNLSGDEVRRALAFVEVRLLPPGATSWDGE